MFLFCFVSLLQWPDEESIARQGCKRSLAPDMWQSGRPLKQKSK